MGKSKKVTFAENPCSLDDVQFSSDEEEDGMPFIGECPPPGGVTLVPPNPYRGDDSNYFTSPYKRTLDIQRKVESRMKSIQKRKPEPMQSLLQLMMSNKLERIVFWLGFLALWMAGLCFLMHRIDSLRKGNYTLDDIMDVWENGVPDPNVEPDD